MHHPVLLQETIDGLALASDLTVVDATVGGAGHAEAIARALGPAGRLIALDRDARAVRLARPKLNGFKCRIDLRTGNFSHLEEILADLGVKEIDRILFDLGFSSDQLLVGRGFSFNTDEPLLMTYEEEPAPGQLTAQLIVNHWSTEDLVEIFEAYGEEPFAKPIAQAIVGARRKQSIETTGQLVALIERTVPAWYRHPRRRRHFATLVFQSLRIAVNDEFGAISRGLASGFDRLRPEGRLAIITFHSGEGRLVKDFFRRQTAEGRGQLVNKKAIRPHWKEAQANPRARSATLRIIKKL